MDKGIRIAIIDNGINELFLKKGIEKVLLLMKMVFV